MPANCGSGEQVGVGLGINRATRKRLNGLESHPRGKLQIDKYRIMCYNIGKQTTEEFDMKKIKNQNGGMNKMMKDLDINSLKGMM